MKLIIILFLRKCIAGLYRSCHTVNWWQEMEQQRRWHDVFWLGIFVIHLVGMGLVLGVLGLNRFKQKNRLDIDKYTYRFMENEAGLTEDYWPLYAVAGGLGTALGWSWLLLLGSRATQMMKVSVHILTTYLAVISVLCFWAEQFFWGVAFAIGAALQFLYVISVIERYGNNQSGPWMCFYVELT